MRTTSAETSPDYRQRVKERVLDEATFVELQLKGPVRGPAVPWRRITVRPVMVKNRRRLQFSAFDRTRDVTKNYEGAEAVARLDEILAIPFSSIVVKSTDADLQVRITKGGKVLVQDGAAARQREARLEHDRPKRLPLPAGGDDAYLLKTGITNSRGEVRPQMQGKYTQINEFLQLLGHTGELEKVRQTPLTIVDCGCGSAYLTFATYHYLRNVRGLPARVTGIDMNESLVRQCSARRDELGYADVRFVRSAILEYEPPTAPDIVLALHACDTATDEALAQGIRWGAGAILAVPCCHHDLNRQIGPHGVFGPVLRHGVLKQRMADLLTDSFRAAILRIMGYRTEVIEFISTEHTAKNLMIRAVRSADPGDPRGVAEYTALKEYWRVTPHLEKLLGEGLTRLLI